jgi:hypothetical protein
VFRPRACGSEKDRRSPAAGSADYPPAQAAQRQRRRGQEAISLAFAWPRATRCLFRWGSKPQVQGRGSETTGSIHAPPGPTAPPGVAQTLWPVGGLRPFNRHCRHGCHGCHYAVGAAPRDGDDDDDGEKQGVQHVLAPRDGRAWEGNRSVVDENGVGASRGQPSNQQSNDSDGLPYRLLEIEVVTVSGGSAWQTDSEWLWCMRY